MKHIGEIIKVRIGGVDFGVKPGSLLDGGSAEGWGFKPWLPEMRAQWEAAGQQFVTDVNAAIGCHLQRRGVSDFDDPEQLRCWLWDFAHRVENESHPDGTNPDAMRFGFARELITLCLPENFDAWRATC